MIKFNELARRAENAGYLVSKLGDTQISVEEPAYCSTIPNYLVTFDDVFGWAVPYTASTTEFEHKVLKDLGYW